MSPVVPHDPCWAPRYAEAAARVVAAMAPVPITLHHIGSTAVPGSMAKPIIDMLGVVESLAALDAASPRLVVIGFEAMGDHGIPGRRYFRLNEGGVRSHHLHIFSAGAAAVTRHQAFRDYLIAHPEVAAAYSALKAGLPTDGYQDAKDPFVTATLVDALAWMQAKRPNS